MHPKYPFFKNSIFMAILACFLWSTAFASIKIGLQYTQPLQFAGIRFMISGLMILPFCGCTKDRLKMVLQHWKPVLLISLFQTFLLYTLFYIGISKTPAAVTAIIIGASPLFIATIAHYTTGKDPMTWRKIIAIVIGFSGIIVLALARNSSQGFQNGMFLGMGILIVANLAGSIGNVLVSKNKTGLPPLLLNSVQIFIGGLGIFLISIPIEGLDFSPKPLPYYLSLGWLSFLSAAAFSIWFVVLSRKEVKVSEINIWKFIIPVFGAILSWILIPEEKPGVNTLMGMCVITCSLVVVNWRGNGKE